MSLTKAQLLDKCKPRVELVKDVPGFGDVWIRSYPQAKMSSRSTSLADGDGNADFSLADVFSIIDQVMIDKDNMMFTDDDIDTLADADAGQLAPLVMAIRSFNERDPKKTNGAA